MYLRCLKKVMKMTMLARLYSELRAITNGSQLRNLNEFTPSRAKWVSKTDMRKSRVTKTVRVSLIESILFLMHW